MQMKSELLWIGATPPESGGETFMAHIQAVGLICYDKQLLSLFELYT
jgi:hypothetical protein